MEGNVGFVVYFYGGDECGLGGEVVLGRGKGATFLG